MASRCFNFFASALVSSTIFFANQPAQAQTNVPEASAVAADSVVEGVPNFGVVSPALWRSAQPSQANFDAMKKAGLKTVINLRDGEKDIRVGKQMAENAGLKYVSLPLSVFKSVKPQEIDKFLKVVNDPVNQPVLVHCRQGQDRTGTMVAIYRLTQQQWSATNAYQEMLKYGFHPIFIGLSNSMYSVAGLLGRPETPPGADEIVSDLKSRFKRAMSLL